MNNRLAAFTQQFLNDTPLSRLFIEIITEYCQRTGLDSRLVEPLFYTCWMHRSLKESMRLEQAKLKQGHFANLIWWCREHRDSTTLNRLFCGSGSNHLPQFHSPLPIPKSEAAP
jgi:hypothetical protein